MMGLSTPQARPSTAMVTASGAKVSVQAATTKRGRPTTRNAIVNTGHRRKWLPTAP